MPRDDSRPTTARRARPEADKSGAALNKALQVLDAVADAPDAIALADLAERIALPKPSLHRLLGQLESAGMIRREPGGKRFAIGPRATSLAVRSLGAWARLPPVHAVLMRVVDRIQESCNLGILDRNEVVYIDRVECNWPLRTVITVGTRVPLHCTSSGKLFLAHMMAGRRRKLLQALPLERRTPNTIVEVEALEREVARAKRDGFATNNQESMVGLIGFGVPVLDAKGRMAAGLALQAPEPRLSVGAARQHLSALREAAAALSSMLPAD